MQEWSPNHTGQRCWADLLCIHIRASSIMGNEWRKYKWPRILTKSCAEYKMTHLKRLLPSSQNKSFVLDRWHQRLFEKTWLCHYFWIYVDKFFYLKILATRLLYSADTYKMDFNFMKFCGVHCLIYETSIRVCSYGCWFRNSIKALQGYFTNLLECYHKRHSPC